MRFTLYYRGELPANGSAADKHRIRTSIDPQLWRLWQQEPLLTLWNKKSKETDPAKRIVQRVATMEVLPIVTSRLFLCARLNVGLLRQGPSGRLVVGGDLDNRLKTLFDALRMPRVEQEIPAASRGSAQTRPLCCLLEDDALITDVSVRSAQWLDAPNDREVVLLIEVVIEPVQLSYDNMGLL